MSIDRNSPLPLYYQLKQLLLAKIESGALESGDIFPTEQQIQTTYDVSRTTVRQALSELEDEGRITRHRGRGTFVSKPKLGHNPDHYPKLADHMTEQGLQAGWTVLSAGWIDADETVTDLFGLDTSRKIYRLERLRLEDVTPIGYHLAYVPPEFTYAIDETSFTDGGSLRYLRGMSTLSDCVANRVLEAVSANKKLASALNIAEGDPLLRVKRIIHNHDEQAVEYFVGWYRGDRFEYHISNMRAISGINA